VPRFREPVPIDNYVLDVLMRDLVGHDHQPAAFLVYLCLYRQAQRQKWGPIAASLRMLAEATGLSKSTTQIAVEKLRARQLISSTKDYTTAIPRHRVLRHWRKPAAARATRKK
jgi:DNA-binding MarR family transcriptional regulator